MLEKVPWFFFGKLSLPYFQALERCQLDKDGLMTLAGLLRVNSRLKLERFGKGDFLSSG